MKFYRSQKTRFALVCVGLIGLAVSAAGGSFYLKFSSSVPILGVPGRDASLETPSIHEKPDLSNQRTSEVSLSEYRVGDEPRRTASAAVPMVEAFSSGSQIAEEVRKFHTAQTSAARGEFSNQNSQRGMVRRIGELIAGFSTKSPSKKDQEAIATYLLSGGSLDGVLAAIEGLPTDTELLGVLRGAYAFGIGDIKKASENLSDVNALNFHPMLAARLLLTQAAITDPQDFAKQKTLLERSAGLLPGTLVEEASLRRLLDVAIQENDIHSFERTLRRYIRRFPKSLYLGEFSTILQNGVLRFEDAGNPVSRPTLHSAIAVLPEPLRSVTVSSLARHATVRGNTSLCDAIHSAQFQKVAVDQENADRDTLYASACRVADRPEEMQTVLVGLSAESLNAEDRKLRLDALRLADAILGTTLSMKQIDQPGPAAADPNTAALLVSAAQRLQTMEGLLREAQ
jgi:chemotaxis protein MotC